MLNSIIQKLKSKHIPSKVYKLIKIGFVIRKDNGSNNSLFLSCEMGLSDGAFFIIKHTPLPNGNHPI